MRCDFSEKDDPWISPFDFPLHRFRDGNDPGCIPKDSPVYPVVHPPIHGDIPITTVTSDHMGDSLALRQAIPVNAPRICLQGVDESQAKNAPNTAKKIPDRSDAGDSFPCQQVVELFRKSVVDLESVPFRLIMLP